MTKEKPCVFCDIIAGKSPATIIEFQNENIVIFKDIKPASDHHYLAVPKCHYNDARTLNVNQKDLVIEMREQLKELLRSKEVDLDDVSYGFHWPPFLSVSHLHMHAIAPASKMGFIARQIFKPIDMWYCSPDYVISKMQPVE